jgi:DNA-binding transcriptional regulator YiaG
MYEVMNMKIEDHLSKRQKKVIDTIRKKNEELSQQDWLEIMGTNKQTLKRGKGGAYRSKRR